MGYVVTFGKGKGGVGASTLARSYAVEAAKAGASVLLADLDSMQLTSKRWAEHRKANGWLPLIRAEATTPKQAYELAAQADVMVIDTPAGNIPQSLKLARWSTFCVVPSGANRMDDLHEAVRVLHLLRKEGIQDWRFGVALNALRAATAQEDDADARAYLAQVGFKALPGHVCDMREYEVALLEGKGITETDDKALNAEAYQLMNGIAGAVLEAAKQLELVYRKGPERGGRER